MSSEGRVFVINDDWHAEHTAEFASFDDAIVQLKEWSTIPWDRPPNRPPCAGWRMCSRKYEIVEFDDGNVLSRVVVLEVSRACAKWFV